MNVFDNIYRIAKQKHLSIKEVSVKAGLSENGIYKWRGKHTPNAESVIKIAEVLHVSYDELMSSPEHISVQSTKIEEHNPDIAFVPINISGLSKQQKNQMIRIVREFGEFTRQNIFK